jgi:2,4-dienoyl-CoA reductase-like NADH-dependent reductase (Old Yellow Enzyme family)
MLQDGNGFVGMDTLCYYTRRVRGGFGLIMSEPLSNSEFADTYSHHAHTKLHKPAHALGWMPVVEAVHTFGGRIIAQIAGGGLGRQVYGPRGKILQPAAASPIPLVIDPEYLANNFDKSSELMSNLEGPVPREITGSEIWAVIEAYYNITKLAIKAGFDGVVLHSCHGYFGHNFLSPNHNKRTDEFGGSFENRTRYLRESFKRIMQAIKDEGVGDKFVAGCRTSAAEHTPGGFTYEDTVKYHQMLIDLGSSFVDLSDGAGYDRFSYFLPSEDMMPIKVEQAKFFDKHLNVPILVPSIHDPVIAEQVAEETSNGIISLGRQSLADPDWPNKVKEGRTEDIVRCRRCNIGCCLDGIFQGLPLRCVLNPEMGHEKYDMANWPKPMIPSGNS